MISLLISFKIYYILYSETLLYQTISLQTLGYSQQNIQSQITIELQIYSDITNPGYNKHLFGLEQIVI